MKAANNQIVVVGAVIKSVKKEYSRLGNPQYTVTFHDGASGTSKIKTEANSGAPFGFLLNAEGSFVKLTIKSTATGRRKIVDAARA